MPLLQLMVLLLLMVLSTIDDNANANNDSITGGSDDIFRVGDTFLAATDSFNGNAGTDTIQLDNGDAVSAALDFD